MFSHRVRIVVKCWLVLSVVVFFVRLGPVMARYRAADQKFADLDFEAKQPAAPVIVNDSDSPVPRLTLALEGRAIEKLDDGHWSWVQATLPNRDSLYLVADRKGYFARLRENRVAFEFPRRGEESDDLYEVAVSSESQIMATIGRHTVVQFWNAFTGELLATVEDENPTIAARQDPFPHAKRHSNKLRYQDIGARRIVASPKGCLFAIGKVDGTIELWGDLTYREHLGRLNEPEPPDSRSLFTSKKFGFISRRKVHDGRVVELGFSHGGKKLVSVGGHRVLDYEAQKAADGTPTELELPKQSSDSKFDVVLSATNSLETEWRQPLPEAPGQLALSIEAQHAVPGMLSVPFAVGMFHHGVILGDLAKKQITGTIKFPARGPSVMVQSVAFHRNENAVLTLHTSYSGVKGNVTIETVLSLWQTSSRRRIATARLAGQFGSAAWDKQGQRLALLRVNPVMSRTANSGTSFFPWFSKPSSPFLFHVWDVRAVPMSDAGPIPSAG